MRTGRDTLQVISEQIQKTQADLEQTGRQLEAVTQRVTALNQELSAGYRRLARIRLNDLMSERLVSELDETDRATLALLEKRKAALQSLRDRLEESLSSQKRLEAERKELAAERDAAGLSLKETMEKANGRIAASEAFIAQRERAVQAEQVARLAEEKALQAERDRKEKGTPYEADSLFMYLWKRRYLTADYTGGWFARSLDGWVAKLIDYQANRANYHLLTEIPARLREHADVAGQKAEQEARALSEIERAGLEADGVPGKRSEVDAVEKRIAAHDAAIEAEEVRYRGLLEEQNRFNEMTDPDAVQALHLQEAGLKSEPMKELFNDALKTAGPEDDAAVAHIQALQQEMTLKKSESQTLQELQRQRQQSLVEMETLRRRYRQEGFDAYHTSFPSDFSLAALLAQLISGALSSETVWQEIGRHRRTWERRSGPSIQIGLPPMGRRGESPWGGRWPQSQGGGGQRNGGGGFGSRGGFRTGGGF